MMTVDNVREKLRSQCEAIGGTSAWARAKGISVQYVNDVVHSRRLPGKAILHVLGLKRRMIYEPVADEVGEAAE